MVLRRQVAVQLPLGNRDLSCGAHVWPPPTGGSLMDPDHAPPTEPCCAWCGRTRDSAPPPGGFTWGTLGLRPTCSERCRHLLCARETDGAHVDFTSGACSACGRPKTVMKHQ